MDPGTALAVVSLAFQAFGGCVQGFTLLSTAHSLGKDASRLRTLLSLEEYRLVQWADKVGLTGPDAKLNPRLNQFLAAELLGQLDVLLRTEKLRERYKFDLRPDPPQGLLGATNDAPTHSILGQLVSNRVKGEILARAKLIQSKNHLPKRLWWAAVDKSKFEALIQDVRAFVEGLYFLLDLVDQKEVVFKVDQVLSSLVGISNDIEGLKELQSGLQMPHDKASTAYNPGLTAAGLKAARLELQDSDNEKASEASTLTIRSRRNILLTPLAASSLTAFRSKPHDGSVGVALYNGSPVYVERKDVPPYLKRKLRYRIENLAVLLHEPKDESFKTLHCIGFFEEQTHYTFVYQYPEGSIGPHPTNSLVPPSQPVSLLDLLRDPSQQPSVSQRIALALKISRTVCCLHTAGWLHKDVRSANVLFFPAASSEVGLEHPCLTHFAFSRANSPTEISEQPSSDPAADIYRHPSALGEPTESFAMRMDLYSLALVLIEIAEWRPLKTLIKKRLDIGKGDVPLEDIAGIIEWAAEKIRGRDIAFRMGDMYSNFLMRVWQIGGRRAPSEDNDPLAKDLEDVELLRTATHELTRFHV